MTDDYDDARREVEEFLASLPPDKSDRPWPARHRIDLSFPPGPRPRELETGPRISATIRFSHLQAHFVRRASQVSGLPPVVWAQRHLLAAAGCPPPKAPASMELLARIYADHVHLDSLLLAAGKQ
ncbi:MAG: hypothetical protein Devi2KO_00800 [Devosia indica]